MSRTPPPIYSDSKYKLSSLCLRSFKAGLGNLKVKIWALLDNCPPEYEALFMSLWPTEDLVLLRYPGIGNAATFGKQIEIMAAQNDADLVYVTEDDYFYLPGQFHLLWDLLNHQPDVDFCSPYDHPDLHNHSFHLHKMRIKVEQGQVWKTANGTTCTFLTRKSTLLETQSTLMSYTQLKRWNVDACMWLSLTKHHVFNPYDLLTQPFIFPYRGASLAFAWLLNWRQILFGRHYTIWISVPSLATHMAKPYMAPFRNWDEEFKRLEKDLDVPKSTASRI